MKRILLSLIFSTILLQVFSQKVYFIYIQNESEQPFFIKMSDKIYNSTASGYIILSKLRDSTHNFSIGFPNSTAEQKFSVNMNTKDHGFMLKSFGDKGWGLFDLQTLAIQMAVMDKKNTEQVVMKEDVSKFTVILAKAVDDSTLLQKTIPQKTEEKKIETVVNSVEKKEDSKDLVQVSQSKKEETKELKADEKKEQKDSALTTQPKESFKSESYKKSIVTRRSESSTTEGFGMTFIDKHENGITDTISIVIPQSKTVVEEVRKQPVEEKKFLDITNEPGVVINKPDSSQVVKENEKKSETTPYKNNCPAIANETDFLDLRRKMATATGDDGMLEVASKFYKTKCFYTGQIKNLSVLFLNDEAKYKFFDVSYKYVADMENYSSLQTEMKDEYYINRFKAMLRQ